MDNKQIKDLSREFSDIEKDIIDAFIEKVVAERVETSKNEFGFSKDNIVSGLTEIEISVYSFEEKREIVLSALRIKKDRHLVLNDPIKNPFDLTEGLNKVLESML